MKLINNFDDYELLDASLGMKYERWGKYYLLRPDPQVIWDNGDLIKKYYNNLNAIYHRNNKGGGYWEDIKKMDDQFIIKYKDLTFNIKKMGFKHTGLFPEQAVNWDYIMEKIENSKRPIKVLNLFAYTGGATVASLKAGASVVHVDSSKGMIDFAKENVNSSGLGDKSVRFLVDDCIKFVEREIRRENKYDAIIMDPPSFGRGSNGEVWDINRDLDKLVNLCFKILSDKPLFLLINSYTSGLSKEIVNNVLKIHTRNYKVNIDSYEIGIPIKNSDLVLPCGISTRCEFYE